VLIVFFFPFFAVKNCRYCRASLNWSRASCVCVCAFVCVSRCDHGVATVEFLYGATTTANVFPALKCCTCMLCGACVCVCVLNLILVVLLLIVSSRFRCLHCPNFDVCKAQNNITSHLMTHTLTFSFSLSLFLFSHLLFSGLRGEFVHAARGEPRVRDHVRIRFRVGRRPAAHEDPCPSHSQRRQAAT